MGLTLRWGGKEESAGGRSGVEGGVGMGEEWGRGGRSGDEGGKRERVGPRMPSQDSIPKQF